MIDKNEFIKALGQPDSGFTAAAQQALDAIRDAGSAVPHTKTRPHWGARLTVIAAVLVVAVLSLTLFTRPEIQTPDKVMSPGKTQSVTHTPTVETTPEPTPAPEIAAEMVPETATPEPTAMSLTEFFAREVLRQMSEQPEQSIGIIGGADGPTEVFISDNKFPETAEEFVHGILFESAFGLTVQELYPSYRLISVIDGVRETNGQAYSGQDMFLEWEDVIFIGLRFAQGEATEANMDGDTVDLMTLWVEMPEDVAMTDAFMEKAEYPAAYVYKESCVKAGEITGNEHAAWSKYPLNGIKVTFDSAQRPIIYQMFFGADCEIYMLWTCDPESGNVSFGNYYTGDYFTGYFDDGAMEQPYSEDMPLPTEQPVPEEE